MEAHLRTAEVTRFENLDTGVTRPRRGYLTPAEPFGSLVWKPLTPSRRSGYWESYKSEIAAYELDKLLKLQMVPPAVEKRINGDTGAAIMWLDGTRSVKDTGGKVPSGAAWGEAFRKMLMFDNLICNKDRNAGNILLGQTGEVILIDHSRAFITERAPKDLDRVDETLWERMKALTRADLDRALGPWLDSGAIDAVMKRRDKMIEDVDKLIARKGRALVIVP